MAVLLRRWGPRRALSVRCLAGAWQAPELARGLYTSPNLAPVKSVQSSPYAQTHTSSGVINFGIGQPSESLLPLDMIRDAAMDRLKPTQDPVLLQYGAAKGFIGFREKIAKLLEGKMDRRNGDRDEELTDGKRAEE
ncbi:unnamed protein product [Phytophthora lilii]|uniref:Unnamed protein product n=1 Tax=Phytophthora lilii TaxID=2077276 RepID=A0A9W6WRV1_9STRA|nr:unnamed protein product [Phytophthora lilii]